MAFTVDPSDVINFNRSDHDLELFWLFCLVVAGKTAKTQARLLDNFLQSAEPLRPHKDSPFGRVRGAMADGVLLELLKQSRLGQFNRLKKAFEQSVLLKLRECSVEDLEAIYGVGPKTARMFLMFTRPNQRFAALDTHLLKHLREKGIDAPLATPPAGKRYRELEEEFLKLVDAAGMTVAEYDLEVWKHHAGHSGS